VLLRDPLLLSSSVVGIELWWTWLALLLLGLTTGALRVWGELKGHALGWSSHLSRWSSTHKALHGVYLLVLLLLRLLLLLLGWREETTKLAVLTELAELRQESSETLVLVLLLHLLSTLKSTALLR